MTTPPCAGQWDLFDSTDPLDHLEAKTLCQRCDMRLECADLFRKVKKDSLGGKDYGPRGTWAGELIDPNVRRRASAATVAAEANLFTDDELKAGHSAYLRGEREASVVRRERIYQRSRKRRRKEAA